MHAYDQGKTPPGHMLDQVSLPSRNLLPSAASQALGAAAVDAGLVPGRHLVEVGADGAGAGALAGVEGGGAADGDARVRGHILRDEGMAFENRVFMIVQHSPAYGLG